MKIAFLCASLEPTKDGVGDYTRLLAAEYLRQDHSCALIALNDRHVSSLTRVDGEMAELRLPSAMSWDDRIAQARAFLDEYAPDWLSFQFVPYGFDKKGIVYGLPHRLRSLLSGRKCHIMLHEIWIGEPLNSTAKDKAIGIVQRFFILNMLRSVRPKVLHTSNQTYVSLLGNHGIKAEMLPLFGNIPIADTRDSGWILSAMREAGIDITPHNKHDFWLGGFFGSLHSIWPPEPLLPALIDAARQKDKRLVLLCAGRLGSGAHLWETMAQEYSGRIQFCKLGERSEQELSQFLQFLDFGIATSPLSLIGKSGCAAAMIEHGLPVVINRNEVRYRSVEPVLPHPYLIDFNNIAPSDLADLLYRRELSPQLPGIARQMESHFLSAGRA